MNPQVWSLGRRKVIVDLGGAEVNTMYLAALSARAGATASIIEEGEDQGLILVEVPRGAVKAAAMLQESLDSEPLETPSSSQVVDMSKSGPDSGVFSSGPMSDKSLDALRASLYTNPMASRIGHDVKAMGINSITITLNFG